MTFTSLEKYIGEIGRFHQVWNWPLFTGEIHRWDWPIFIPVTWYQRWNWPLFTRDFHSPGKYIGAWVRPIFTGEFDTKGEIGRSSPVKYIGEIGRISPVTLILKLLRLASFSITCVKYIGEIGRISPVTSIPKVILAAFYRCFHDTGEIGRISPVTLIPKVKNMDEIGISPVNSNHRWNWPFFIDEFDTKTLRLSAIDNSPI